MSGGQLDTFSFYSSALQGNRLGDPAARDVIVYLPPGFAQGQRYPSIYMLPSHGRTNAYYVAWNQWDERIQDRLDRLILTGVMPPVIVVLPDCWTRFGGSQYVDSTIGNYEQYVIYEVIPEVDKRYPTRTDAANRAVTGHSSGGYGAITLAMKHPDVFGAVACRAPDMYWEYTALPAIAQLPLQMAKWGGFAQFIADIPTIRPKTGDFWQAIHTVMQCMAYGSNPDHPLGFDPPIDTQTGALISDVWERWLIYDPVRMVDQPVYQAALRKMSLVYLEAGRFDSYLLQIGARIFAQKLESAGIPYRYDEFDDGHSSTSYRYDVSLPLLVQAINQ